MEIQFPYRVIGVMSGTSLDGIDLALIEFSKNKDQYRFKLLKGITLGYDKLVAESLKNSRYLSNDKLILLHNQWGRIVGEAICQNFKEELKDVDLISSHGHTVFHEPRKGFTLQIGSLELIQAITGKNVVGDFRCLDVSKGGEGAPLVPIGDQLLFSEYAYCLNLGGIANVSFDQNGKRIAFDVAPCNLIFNYLAEKLGLPYDAGGSLGKKGNLDFALYQKLSEHSLYALNDKPSLGIEYISKEFYPLFEAADSSIEDQLHTGYQHLADVIARTCGTEKQILLSGGGAHNSFLVECMTQRGLKVVIPSKEIIDFKEALVFAFLGLRRVEGKINVLSSVTGASSDSCSGQLFLT